MRLKDRVMVVTGSTRGIGRAIVEAAAAEGARVVVCAREAEAVRETVAALQSAGCQASGLAIDVTREDELARLLAHARDTWGRVDVWVNNAGASAGRRPLEKLSTSDIDRLIGVNFLAVLRACRLVLPFLARQEGGGMVLNLSGKGGDGRPSSYKAVYAATKAAVVSLSRSLAQEYRGKPVSVHVISPGMVRTSFYDEVFKRPELAAQARSLRYVLDAVGVPAPEVGHLVAEVAAQPPGRATGRQYSALRGARKLRSVMLLAWYRATGKISGAL
jgi:NAD(P)-dependent dehydrogenase (short-subunit alcohol dehydrogenase family)